MLRSVILELILFLDYEKAISWGFTGLDWVGLGWTLNFWVLVVRCAGLLGLVAFLPLISLDYLGFYWVFREQGCLAALGLIGLTLGFHGFEVTCGRTSAFSNFLGKCLLAAGLSAKDAKSAKRGRKSRLVISSSCQVPFGKARLLFGLCKLLIMQAKRARVNVVPLLVKV